MFGRIARGVTARPWLVIVGWAIAAIAVIALSPKLGSVTTSDQAAFLPATTESARAAELARQAFPDATGSTGVIVVTRADGAALADTDQSTLGAVTLRLNTDKPTAVRGVQFDPVQSVSRDGRVALLGVAFTGPAEDSGVQAAVTTLRTDVATTLSGTDLTAGMTGQAAIAVDNKKAFGDAEGLVTVVTVGLIVTLLLIIFRSPLAALLPLATVGLVFGMSASLSAIVAKAFGLRVGQELPTMLTVVLFGIGTDYILFLLFRYRERLRAGDSPRTAIVAAVERVGEAIFSAAFAVIAAFGALALALLGFFRSLGPALAIGVFVMLLAALTLVPAVVTVLGRAVFWPVPPNRHAAGRGGFAALGRLVARWPVVAVVVTVALLGGLTAGALAFKPSYDPIGQLPAKTEAARAFEQLKSGFPAGALQPTDVYLHADRPLSRTEVASFVERMAKVPGVAGVLAPRTSADGSTVDVQLVLAGEPYSPAALDLVSGPLRDTARAAAPEGTQALVGGQSMAFADIRATTNRDLRVIFPVAGLLFLLILAALLRAVFAPAYLVVMVVVGFAATLGAAALAFGGAVAFTIPIIVYLFVTAIGTDYNILVTARLREEIRDGRGYREAARLAVTHAGPSVAAAAMILAGTFGALMVPGVPFFTQIGFSVSLGILIVSFVVSLVLVPAVTALLGRAAWWPGTRPPTAASHDGASRERRHRRGRPGEGRLGDGEAVPAGSRRWARSIENPSKSDITGD